MRLQSMPAKLARHIAFSRKTDMSTFSILAFAVPVMLLVFAVKVWRLIRNH